jgi:hypothetical protein
MFGWFDRRYILRSEHDRLIAMLKDENARLLSALTDAMKLQEFAARKGVADANVTQALAEALVGKETGRKLN